MAGQPTPHTRRAAPYSDDRRMIGSLSVTAMTHRGARRSANEDAISIGAWASSADMDAPVQRVVSLRTPVVCAVADGVGGYEGGALASRFVLSRLSREAALLADPESIKAFLQRLERDLVQLGAERGLARPPGTTLAALLFPKASEALAVNVGDSRLYRLTRQGISRISTDDTAGRQDDPDGRTGTHGHVLTQAIGGKPAPGRITPHVTRQALGTDAVFLLCTDGVTDVVGNSDLARLARAHDDDDPGLVQAIFDLAMARGGPDNLSACLVRPGP